MPTKEQPADKGPSAELQAFYEKYTQEQVTACEVYRTEYHRAYGTLLPLCKAAHKVFAGKGRDGKFRQWCTLAKVNYASALVMLSQDRRKSVKQLNTSGQGKQAQWTAKFTDPAKQVQWDKCVRRVMKAYDLQRGKALEFIRDVFEEHWDESMPAPATDATQPRPAKAKGNAA